MLALYREMDENHLPKEGRAVKEPLRKQLERHLGSHFIAQTQGVVDGLEASTLLSLLNKLELYERAVLPHLIGESPVICKSCQLNLLAALHEKPAKTSEHVALDHLKG